MGDCCLICGVKLNRQIDDYMVAEEQYCTYHKIELNKGTSFRDLVMEEIL